MVYVSKYKKGDDVKIEVANEEFGGAGEWVLMLVDHSDDEQRLVFGQLDNEPIVSTDMGVGQQLAIYESIREHRRLEEDRLCRALAMTGEVSLFLDCRVFPQGSPKN